MESCNRFSSVRNVINYVVNGLNLYEEPYGSKNVYVYGSNMYKVMHYNKVYVDCPLTPICTVTDTYTYEYSPMRTDAGGHSMVLTFVLRMLTSIY